MKRKKRILIVALLAVTSTVFAQGNTPTINNQFSTIFDTSSSYKNFKLVDQQSLRDLEKNIADSIQQYKSSLASNQILINQNKEELTLLTTKLEQAENDLKSAANNEENFTFLGISTHQTTFQVVILTLFAFLFVLMALFYFRFKKCHVDTKDAVRKLKETDEELEEFRKTSLEREQKIRRQLQDEINKNKDN
ncbi:hypothetical protein [Myroides odoratus]|uniref:hypothetical protein n=1 Tax=Myroides odoratus TaxID=256 RepID=UPI0039AEAB20